MNAKKVLSDTNSKENSILPQRNKTSLLAAES